MRKKYDLKMVSQQINIEGKTYKDWVDITPQVLFDMLKQETITSMTSQPAMPDWHELLEKARKNQEDVFIMTMPMALSGTYAGALLAAKEYEDVNVVVRGARTVSLGSTLIAERLAQQADKGASLQELVALFDDLNARIRTLVVVGDMEMLKRGGRISPTTALVGKALNIKPILEIDAQGKLVSLAKVRGWKKVREFLYEQFVALANPDEPFGIAHAVNPEEKDALRRLLHRHAPGKDIVEVELGAVIGSHVGPTTLGFAFFSDKPR